MPSLTDFLLFLQDHGYAAFIGILLISGFGVPLPEDIPLLIGGYLSSPAVNILNLWVTIVVAMISILGADCFFYFLGRHIRYRGDGKMPRFVEKLLTPERQKKIDLYFKRYGARTAFFGRFLPGLRSPIFFCTGLWGVSFSRFFLSDGLAALLSVPALVVVGYLFGDNLEQIKQIVGRVEYVIVGAIVLFVVITVLVHYLRNRREAKILKTESQNDKEEAS